MAIPQRTVLLIAGSITVPLYDIDMSTLLTNNTIGCVNMASENKTYTCGIPTPGSIRFSSTFLCADLFNLWDNQVINTNVAYLVTMQDGSKVSGTCYIADLGVNETNADSQDCVRLTGELMLAGKPSFAAS